MCIILGYYKVLCSGYPFQWVIPTVFLYDLVDHDIPPVYWWSMWIVDPLWKEKYKFREIFLLRRSHIWHLFLRSRLGNPQFQPWICLQRWKLPLHRMHVQVWEQNSYNSKHSDSTRWKSLKLRKEDAKSLELNVFLERATVSIVGGRTSKWT